MTMMKALLSAVAALALTALMMPSASAHTAMLRASPERNATAGGSIQFIDLEFLDPVTDVSVAVTYNGVPVAGRVIANSGELITFTLDQPLSQAGRYQVNYEMTSFDSDFTTGGYFFSFDPTADQPGRIEFSDSGRLSLVTLAASGIGLAALVGLLLLFVRRIDRQRSQQFIDVADDWAEDPYR